MMGTQYRFRRIQLNVFTNRRHNHKEDSLSASSSWAGRLPKEGEHPTEGEEARRVAFPHGAVEKHPLELRAGFHERTELKKRRVT